MIALKLTFWHDFSVCSAQDYGMLFTSNKQHYNLSDTLCHVVKRGILELDLKNIYKYIYSNWFVESFISQKYKLDYIYSLAWHTGN